MKRLDAVAKQLDDYMSEKPDEKSAKVAYFSMEYGLHSSLKIYSGGLGILAGDYLKEASDKNVPMAAVGLLYRSSSVTVTAFPEWPSRSALRAQVPRWCSPPRSALCELPLVQWTWKTRSVSWL